MKKHTVRGSVAVGRLLHEAAIEQALARLARERAWRRARHDEHRERREVEARWTMIARAHDRG